MNTTTMNRFREMMISRKAELLRDVDHLEQELRDLSVEQDAEGGGAGNHFADDGSSLGEQERISTIGNNFREQLTQIDQALQRIETGSYGTCQRCGRQIPEDRLEALPFTPFCIECQSHLERQAELFGSAPGSN